MNYKSSANIVFSCQYHIIFCPKYRRKVLVDGIATRLKEIVREVATELMVEIIEIETDHDHIHILAGINPLFSVNKFVKAIKGRSSRLLRTEFPELKTKLPTLWTNSCFISTVGGAPFEAVKHYIENQQKGERENDRIKWQKYLDDINSG